jgi:hypothetical protein
VDEGSADAIQKIKKSDYDEAFDSLAAFLFEQYKKMKQASIVND